MDEIKVIERIATMEQDLKSIHRRIDNLEELTRCVQTIANELTTMREDMNDIASRVGEIEKKPSKRYETVVTAIITAVATFAATWFLKK